FLSGPALERDFQAATGRALRVPGVGAEASAGEAAAGKCLEQYVDRMARALASVINVLDPSVIVLGGGLSNIHTLYAKVPDRFRGYVFSDRVVTKLVPAAHGDSSGVRGAAWLWDE